MLLITAIFIIAFFKELRLTAFDPALANTQGIHAGVMHYALMVLVAAATVAAFEAVGSILVIAMLIAPAATARLLTDRLLSQVLVSLVVAVVTAIAGYAAATLIPAAFDFDSVNAAGSMSVIAGVLILSAVFCSPRHGLWPRAWRRRRLQNETAVDDLLAALFRLQEAGINHADPQALGTRSMFDPTARQPPCGAAKTRQCR